MCIRDRVQRHNSQQAVATLGQKQHHHRFLRYYPGDDVGYCCRARAQPVLHALPGRDYGPVDLADDRTANYLSSRYVFFLFKDRAVTDHGRADPRPRCARDAIRGHYRDGDPDRF